MESASAQKFDFATEDRALQGCNSSAEATLQTAGGPASNELAGVALPAGASPSGKSQGVRGTESPDSSDQTLKKTSNWCRLFGENA